MLTAVAALVAAVMVVAPQAAQAVHDEGLFELDTTTYSNNGTPTPIGDANVQSQAPIDQDWDKVFAGTSTDLTHNFIVDGVSGGASTPNGPLPNDQSFFFGGGSKDTNDIPQWQYSTTDVSPNKDEIVNAFISVRTPTSGPNAGHQIWYFGADRYDNNGDAQVAFWFFKDQVALGPSGPLGGGATGGGFIGHHNPGDILVVADFVSGGKTARMTVYNVASISGNGNVSLNQLFTNNNADCATAPANDTACAVVNNNVDSQGRLPGDAGYNGVGETPPWAYVNQSGQNSYAPASLFEGGIDVDTLLGHKPGCYSSFLAETRSSQSTSSQLKDLALGQFPLCDAKIAIAPSGVNGVGSTHTFTASMQVNDGSGYHAAPDGTQINLTSTGTGSLSAPSCLTSGGTGSCTVNATSAVAGVQTVSACGAVLIESVTFNRCTDGTVNNSGPATKRWVDASVAIGPSAVNEVTQSHTFTVTVTANPSGTTPSFGAVVPTVTPAPADPPVSTCASPTINGDVASCTVTINSDTAATFTANATATVNFHDGDAGANPADATVVRSTSGVAGPAGSGPATKQYVDGAIQISPNAVNEVGTSHTFTVRATAIPGSVGGPYTFAITPSISPAPASQSSTCDAPTVISATVRECTVTIDDPNVGAFTANASAQITMGGVAVTRSTSGNSGPGGGTGVVKRYVDASIGIAANGVNQVGDSHTFTVTVHALPGATAPTFGPVGITWAGPTPTITGSTCATPTVSPADPTTATCAITFTSTTAGTFVANATGSVTFADSDPAADPPTVTVTRSTSGVSGPGGTGPATKRFVDASIQISPDAVNEVTHSHTFTVTVTANGQGTTPSLTAISTDVQPANLLTQNDTTCAAGLPFTGNVATCTVTIDSSSVATFTANASATVSFANGDGTATVTRSTSGVSGPGGSGPATKRYVDASILISPNGVNEVGDSHTFTIQATALPGSVAGPYTVAIHPTLSYDPSLPAPAVTTDCSTPTPMSATVWQCSYTIQADSVGAYTVDASADFVIGGVALTRDTAGNSGPGGGTGVVKRYVDANIAIAPNGVNAVGHAHTFTVTETALPGATSPAFGPIAVDVNPAPSSIDVSDCAAPHVSGNVATCQVTINSLTAGTFTANAGGTVTFTDPDPNAQPPTATVTRATNGNAGPGGSGPATKRYVEASVAIAPSAVNEVGQAHVFTVTVTADSQGATPTLTAISTDVSPANGLTQNDSTCAPNLAFTGNVATCTVTINSNDVSTYTANATATVSFANDDGTADVTRSTSGTAGPAGSGPATKQYVDASVTITPNAVNEVGASHTFTITATALPGSVPGPITFALSPSVSPAPASQSSTCASPTVVSATVQTCTLTISDPNPGAFTANAQAVVVIGGVTLTRDTAGDSGPGGGVAVVKRYVDSNIVIAPSAVNEVGHPHVFTITETATPGATSPSFSPIQVIVTPAPGSVDDSDCAAPHVNGAVATCAVTINSTVVGTFTANATGTVTFTDSDPNATPATATLTRSTSGNAGPGGSGPATKQYVDAAVSISPNGVNEVGASHTFTVTATALPGAVVGPYGFSIAPSVSPTPASQSDTCATPTALSPTVQTCTLTISDPGAGAFTANAVAQVVIGGVTVVRDTAGNAGPGGGPAVVKRYVDASIAISPNGLNTVGNAHTFTVTETAIAGTTAPSFSAITVTVLPVPNTIDVSDCAAPHVNGNVATCAVTINSPTAGTFVANAAGAVTFADPDPNANPATVTVIRSTSGNAGPGGSGPAVKRYVDASVAIAPSAVNAVGQAHTFTVTVTADSQGSTPTLAAISTSVTPTNGLTQNDTTCAPGLAFSGGVATCTITINSDSVATFTADAAVTVSFANGDGTASVDRSTSGDAGPVGSGSATKQYVDGSVVIAPNAVNEVGTTHVFTVTATALPGAVSDAITFAITPSVSPAPASQSDTCATPTVLSPTVQTCTLTISDPNAGAAFTANAHAVMVIGGVTVTRDTASDSGPGGGSPVVKRYVDSNISISPNGVNEVGQPHTFTITETATPGATSPSFGPITVTVSPAPGSIDVSDCAAPHVTGNTATCTATINSTAPGLFVANASGTVTFTDSDPNATPATVTLTRSTSGTMGAGGSGPATKRYVDAHIAIAPNATNGIGEAHTFTVTVTSASAGLPAVINSITTSVTNNPQIVSNGCADSTTWTTNGAVTTCTLVINSTSAGSFVASATASVTMGTVTVTRSTTGTSGNSGPATKTYVDGSIRWVKQDGIGNLLGGATFQVCQTKAYVSATNSYVSITPVCVSVVDNAAPDADPAAGKFLLAHQFLGEYTIVETAAPAGFQLNANDVRTVDLSVASPNADISGAPFINTPNICGRTIGFWKNHTTLWDSSSDFTVQQLALLKAAGATAGPAFTTNTVFPWETGSMAGKTYLQILNTPVQGDQSINLAQQYIGALLNSAGYGVPASITTALQQAETFLMAHPVGSKPTGAAATQAGALQSILGNYNQDGETGCTTNQLPGPHQ